LTFLLLLPVILSLLVLGAHFLRSGVIILVLGMLALVGCLAVRRRWVPRVVAVVLGLGAIEWVRTLLLFSGERIATGQPYVRLVVILGGVALFTALSGLVFLSPRLRLFYAPASGSGS
jgi:hypothetical protein